VTIKQGAFRRVRGHREQTVLHRDLPVAGRRENDFAV
jgi:hypothetical protein